MPEPLRPRPLKHLKELAGDYPEVWQELDRLRADRGKGRIPSWADWCFIPFAAADMVGE